MNFLIRLLHLFRRPIDGDPNVWLERPWRKDPTWRDAHCGSCRVLYRFNNGFEVLAVENTKKNGDFDRVLEWFEKSCGRIGADLIFLEVNNPKLWHKLCSLGFEGTQKRLVKKYTIACKR